MGAFVARFQEMGIVRGTNRTHKYTREGKNEKGEPYETLELRVLDCLVGPRDSY